MQILAKNETQDDTELDEIAKLPIMYTNLTRKLKSINPFFV